MNVCITLNGIPRCSGSVLDRLHGQGGAGPEVFIGLIILFLACIGLFVFRDPR